MWRELLVVSHHNSSRIYNKNTFLSLKVERRRVSLRTKNNCLKYNSGKFVFGKSSFMVYGKAVYLLQSTVIKFNRR